MEGERGKRGRESFSDFVFGTQESGRNWTLSVTICVRPIYQAIYV